MQNALFCKLDSGEIAMKNICRGKYLYMVFSVFLLLCSSCVSPENTENNAPENVQKNPRETQKVPEEKPIVSQEENWQKSIRGSYKKWTPPAVQKETKFTANEPEYELAPLQEQQPAASEKVPPAPVPAVMPSPAEHSRRTKKFPSAVHTVQQGETLWGIARKYYGQGWKWPEIQKHNGERLKKGTIINPGLVLVIPSITVETEKKEDKVPVAAKEIKKDDKAPAADGVKKEDKAPAAANGEKKSDTITPVKEKKDLNKAVTPAEEKKPVKDMEKKDTALKTEAKADIQVDKNEKN